MYFSLYSARVTQWTCPKRARQKASRTIGAPSYPFSNAALGPDSQTLSGQLSRSRAVA